MHIHFGTRVDTKAKITFNWSMTPQEIPLSPMLQFSPRQRQNEQKHLLQRKILFTICNEQYSLYWDLLYSSLSKEFDKTSVKSVLVKKRPYIKECYNECWWVRITIMNAIDVYTLLCPDYNYLQPLELSMLVSLFFFPFRRQLK